MNPKIYDRTDAIEKGTNNFWYRFSGACKTTVVFVHGIFSDSRDCWTASKTGNLDEIYWPDLLLQDQSRIGEVNVYMGGFFTAVDAGSYDIFDCSRELFSALSRVDEYGNPPVLHAPAIIFICHSTGGIVARHLLHKHKSSFSAKSIGLVLIASPSNGSDLAAMLAGLAEIYNSKLAAQLATDSSALQDLDRNFKDLVHDSERNFTLTGVEAYENRFIIHRKWFPNKSRVVSESSAGKYFASPVHLSKTDHFTSVKPKRLNDPPHLLLVDFFRTFRKGAPACPDASLEPTVVKKVAGAAGETIQDHEGYKIKIGFVDLFLVDQISVVSALQDFGSRRQVKIEIVWPTAITLMVETLQSLVKQVTALPRPDWTKTLPNNSIADFVAGASRALSEYEEITKQIEARLPRTLKSLSKMSQSQVAVDFTPPRAALGNFLALGVWRAGQNVSYWASFEPIRKFFDLSGWERILRSPTNPDRMGFVLGIEEEICSARVTKVGDRVLHGGNYEYLYGPKSAVVECDCKHERIFPKMRWYYEWIIPQVELLLAECDDDLPVEYDESITPTGVVKNLQGQELYWSVHSNQWQARS
jgi:pimeloyl-ACP methyl ester carboxylesterase